MVHHVGSMCSWCPVSWVPSHLAVRMVGVVAFGCDGPSIAALLGVASVIAQVSLSVLGMGLLEVVLGVRLVVA